MFQTRLKQKLQRGEVALGTWLTIGNTDIVDMLKHLQFDWFVIDTEHSYLTMEVAKNILQTLGDSQQAALIRVGINDQLLIKRALDIGAAGLVIPLVNSGEEARRAVQFARYPPQGVRGAASSIASSYGMELGEYFRKANDNLLIAVQLETKDALKNAEEILSTDGVDIGFVGPTDLTMSLGLIDDRQNPKVIEAMKVVVAACQKKDKVPGTMAVSVEEAKKWLALGFKFVSLGSDAKQLIMGAKTFLQL